uniref:Uncharacterized protein n=1 Tax=Rangifer tarandus platyrhynchus TaxID=3082113 RepID=A0ACB0EYP7_RANTA|nr:unnamed protein product [Rangifer tarandus platyrhynchus]
MRPPGPAAHPCDARGPSPCSPPPLLRDAPPEAAGPPRGARPGQPPLAAPPPVRVAPQEAPYRFCFPEP